MNLDAIVEWAAMGRHGFYVWLAYGGATVVLAGLVLESRRAASRLWQEIEGDVAVRKESEQS